MMRHPLQYLVAEHRAGRKRGITSVCSAHPVVIEAALRMGLETGGHVLIEATCNQVNQEGGYTGMTPGHFRDYVESIAKDVGFDSGQIILGGDHLGPNPWKHLPAEAAMQRAEAMIAAFAAAGFTKLHLDTSMGCSGEPIALTDELTASRAGQLASVAERHKGGTPPVYVIGTEVPVPGGAVESLDHMQVTKSESVVETYEAHRAAFRQLALDEAFSRVIALVVQPGVEFGHSEVIHYDRTKAQDLSAALQSLSSLVFEAHSTDYQTEDGLSQMVEDGFAILKVGPWLTFALRETLYGLDAIADVLDGHPPKGNLMSKMEQIMLDSPANWSKYYEGNESDLWLQRHFSYSDRIRYYWPGNQAEAAVKVLRDRLSKKEIIAPLISQYLPAVQDFNGRHDFFGLQIASVQNILRLYDAAIRV